MGWMPFLLLNQ